MKQNKFFKIISLIVTLILAFVPFINVQAEENISVTKRTYIYVDEENTNRRESKYLTSKGYAFCITPEKTGAREGIEYKYAGIENNNELIYLMLYGDNEDDYDYLTKQLAIWKEINNFLPDYYLNNSNLEIMNRVDSLINKAKANSVNYSLESSVELDYDESKFESTLINGKRYTKSGIITTHITNGMSTEYKLEGAPTGTKLFDLNNNELNSISDGTKFYIVVPTGLIKEEITFSVSITASGVTKKAERYTPTTGDWQDMVIITSESTTATDKMTFTIGNKKIDNACEFIDGKYYDEDGNETDKENFLTTCEIHKCEKVDGIYFDENGQVTDVDSYDKQCVKHTCEIIGDTYYDSLGNKTTKDEYRTQCELVSCEIINGKYFGNEGDVVTPQEFRNQCEAQIVPVPDTKTSSIISIIIGISMLAIAAKCIFNYSKNN
jgi:hypothetical protein